MDIHEKKLDELISVIETYRRRKVNNNDKDVKYISINNEIEKIKAPCCHIIEARRGCGKTTFITKSLSELNEIFQIFVDCQKFSGVHQDIIILNIFSEVLENIEIFLSDENIIECEKKYLDSTKGFKGFLKKKFNKINLEIVTNYKQFKALRESVLLLKNIVRDLIDKPNEQVYNYENSIDNTQKKANKKNKQVNKEFSISSNSQAEKSIYDLQTKIKAISNYKRVSEKMEEEINEHIRTSKIDSSYHKIVKKSELIDNLKVCFMRLFENIQDIYGKRIVLFLDDFYQIEMDSQPRILQYFHGIYKESKNNAFCFKAVAIPDSTKINNTGQIIFSRKDDFPTISLNYDLFSLEALVNKLVKIMLSIKPSIGITDGDIRTLFTPGTLLYLAVGSGGIPRDFMALFSDTLIKARDKGNSQINKFNLYEIISDIKKEKDSDRDVDLKGFTSECINKVLIGLEELVDKLNSNVILYPADKYKQHEKLLKALINLRYIHIINEHVTPEGKNYETVGILIDMTLYATSGRLPNGFKFCEFWRKDKHSNELRKAKIYYFQEEFFNEFESC